MADAGGAACGHDHDHSHMAPEAPKPTGLKGAIETIREVQERRSETFFLFERGFQEYLRGVSDFAGYRALCHEVTEAFTGLSSQMLEVRDQLTELGRGDLVELVGRIQALEKQRLGLVAQSQIERGPLDPEATGSAGVHNGNAGSLTDTPGAGEAGEAADASAAAEGSAGAAAAGSAGEGGASAAGSAAPPKSCGDTAADTEAAGQTGMLTDGGGKSGEIRREFLAVCQQLAECIDELKYEELDD